MTERIAALMAEKMEQREHAQAEHDARVALAMEPAQAFAALAMVKSPSAPLEYVRRYTDVMLLALTSEDRA